MSEKNLIYSVLYDYYSPMLKENQRLSVDLYYNLDFSFTEIAEELGISRSGAYDTLKRAERKLDELEDKLALNKRMQNIYVSCEKIKFFADNLNGDNFADMAEKIKVETEAIIVEG